MPDRDYSNQPRILWNIKANEVLIEALKLSPQSDHNCRWMAQLEEANEALKSRSLLYEPFQLWYRKYNPDQPRVSAGNPDGGRRHSNRMRLTEGGAIGKNRMALLPEEGASVGALPAKKPDIGPKAPDGTPVRPAQADSDNPQRYTVDDEEEVPKGIGHQSRHVAQDEALKARMRTDYRQWPTPGGKATEWAEAYGSFDNQINANDMVNRVLQNNRELVDAVANGELDAATLNMRFGHPTGREAYRPKSNSYSYMRTTFNVRVRIEHDKRTKRGYPREDSNAMQRRAIGAQAMKIPPEFPELCVWFNPAILDAFPEVTDRFAFALGNITDQQQQVIKAFILDVLENVHDSEELNRIWRAADSNILFSNDDGIRDFLAEIVRRIG